MQESSFTVTEIKFIVLWSVALIIILAITGGFSVLTANQYREEAMVKRNARMDPKATEPGRVAAEIYLPYGATPHKVTVGMYLDGISSISILDSSWDPVFYIWFRWKDNDINPGENFQVVDGKIEEKNKISEQIVNGEHYAMYFVRAHITKFFTTLRFPVDDHLLTLAIEDENLLWKDLEYVPDVENSNISSRVKIPGYIVYKTDLVMKPHSYSTNFGDTEIDANKITYSQLIYGIWNARPGVGPYLKIFVGLFAAILVAMLSFFIKPVHVDPRFGLSVGGFFGAVANMLLGASLVPESGTLTLMDMVNGMGILIIFITLIQSITSLYIYDTLQNIKLSKLLDVISFIILMTGAIIINVLIPFMAITRLNA